MEYFFMAPKRVLFLCGLLYETGEFAPDPRRREGVALCNLSLFLFFQNFSIPVSKAIEKQETEKTDNAKGKNHFESKSFYRNVITRGWKRQRGKGNREKRKETREHEKKQRKGGCCQGRGRKNVRRGILKSQRRRRPRTAGRGVSFGRRVRGADPDEAETRRGYHATDCSAWFPVS